MTGLTKFLTTVVVAASAQASALAGDSQAAEGATAVLMRPFHVQGEYFVVNISGHIEGVVGRAVITNVTPGTKVSEVGIERRDEVESIDGIPVIGMKNEAFLALINRPVVEGHPQTVVIVRKRGLLWLFLPLRFVLVFTRVPK